MSLIINNILNPNDVGTVSSGNLGLFAGPGDEFYAKKSDGTTYPISSLSYNSLFSFNPLNFELSISDKGGTLTASLFALSGGYFNTNLTFSNDVLYISDGYSTLTASLSYYAGGFNTSMSYNTASNVLSITDGQGTISATLSLTGANTSLTFNPFNNVLSIVDGFSTKTASLALLSGNTGLSFSNNILTLQDGRGTVSTSLTSFIKIGQLDYTTLNNGGTNSVLSLSSGNVVPSNSKIISVFGKVNQSFVSPTAQITGFAFYGATAGTPIASFDWTNFSNFFIPNEPVATGGGQEAYKLFTMTQSIIHSYVTGFYTPTSSVTFSAWLSYSNGTSQVLNPQNWTAGNVSFVVEYQSINLNSLPF